MSPPLLKSVYFWESFGQVVLPGNGPNPHGEGGWRQPWQGLPVASFRLGRGWMCAKASVGGLSFPQKWFSLEKQVLPGGSLQEAMSLSTVPAWGTASGCGLCRVSAAWMAPVPAPLWHSPGLLSAKCCAHTACRPRALAEGLLEKESCVRVT